MSKNDRSDVAIIIPAFNEELVIGKTLTSLLKVLAKKDIYIVDDCSIDKTTSIAKKYTRNVLLLEENRGKAKALNEVIKYYNLTRKYRYIMPIDADSNIDELFLEKALAVFHNNSKTIAVVGRVKGKPHNWITAYRCWEYEIGQEVHKRAQSYANMVSVCPGPSTVYRSSLFNKIRYSSETKTEDMDLTFLIHRKKLGKIRYESKAVVNTQDPKTIKEYLRQVDRWYTGFWQCVLKHNIPWQGQKLDFEIGLLAMEGLFNGVLIIALIFFLPLLLTFGLYVFLVPLLIDFVVFVVPSLIYTSIKYKTPVFFKYLLHFYFMRILTGAVLLKSFVKVVFLLDRKLGWNKASRYVLNTDGK